MTVVVQDARDYVVDVLVTVQVRLEGLLRTIAMLECLPSKLEQVLINTIYLVSPFGLMRHR